MCVYSVRAHTPCTYIECIFLCRGILRIHMYTQIVFWSSGSILNNNSVGFFSANEHIELFCFCYKWQLCFGGTCGQLGGGLLCFFLPHCWVTGCHTPGHSLWMDLPLLSPPPFWNFISHPRPDEKQPSLAVVIIVWKVKVPRCWTRSWLISLLHLCKVPTAMTLPSLLELWCVWIQFAF